MKILMYSDIHISRTSSILPVGNMDKYTYRQQMIIETAKLICNIAEQQDVDLILNLGDTFDQHTLTSYDVEVASEFFKQFRLLNKPHLVLVGNHEMINKNYNAVKLLSNIPNITVIDKPSTISGNIITNNTDDSNLQLAFLPYNNFKNIVDIPKGDFLISHNDIQGSEIRSGIKLPEGLSLEQLKSYKLVFNGHIHKSGIFSNIVNVGSSTTHSFSDDNDSLPKVYVFNTATLDLNSFVNKTCPLFRTFKIQSLEDLKNLLTNNLDLTYKYILHIISPYSIKDEVKQLLNKLLVSPKHICDDIAKNDTDYKVQLLNYKVTTYLTEQEKQAQQQDSQPSENVSNTTNLDITSSFKEFLTTVDLKYPMQMYMDVLNDDGGEVNAH